MANTGITACLFVGQVSMANTGITAGLSTALLMYASVFFTSLLVVEGVEDKTFYVNLAQEELRVALNVVPNTKVAKNVIFMMGDGMGISTITASRIYKGQKAGTRGDETKLHMDKLPHVALSKTYSADRQVTESASTATALVGGVKVNYGTVGVDARVARANCSLMQDPSVHVTSIMDWSLAEGKSVGIVTTSRVTHASPAAVFAHSPDRDWETHKDMLTVPDKRGCLPDIAAQLIWNNSDINVILGGGRLKFYNRTDGKDLLQEWQDKKKAEVRRFRSVSSASEFRSLQPADVDYVLGLFAESHMSYELSRNTSLEPSLAEMTEKAIQILSKNPKGFFLFVEGARVDMAHHENWAKLALEDTVALDDAVGVAASMSRDDTLLIVTADHSHPFNIVGYPARGNNILGLVTPIDIGQEPLDGLPYSTLSYANGPGPSRTLNLSSVNTTANDFRFPVHVPFQAGWETHSGEEVAIFASGPMAHLFHGVHEQHYIAHVMAYASCVGINREHCQRSPASGAPPGPTPRPNPASCLVASIALLRVTMW